MNSKKGVRFNLYGLLVLLMLVNTLNATQCVSVDYKVYSTALQNYDLVAHSVHPESEGPCSPPYIYRPFLFCETFYLDLYSIWGGSTYHANQTYLNAQYQSVVISIKPYDVNAQTCGATAYTLTINAPFTSDYVPMNLSSIGSPVTGIYCITVTATLIGGGTEDYYTLKGVKIINPNDLLQTITTTGTDACTTNSICLQTNASNSLMQTYGQYMHWVVDGNDEGDLSSLDPNFCTTLSTGQHTIKILFGTTIYDFAECVTLAQKTINIGAPVSINSVNPTSISACRNAGNLVPITIDVQNGTQPYTYQWNNTTGLTSSNVNNHTLNPATALAATYVITVTDWNNCTATAAIPVDLKSNCCLGSTVTVCGQTRSLTYNNANISQIYTDLCGTGNTINLSNLGPDRRITINGILTVNGNYTILNSTYTNTNVALSGGIAFAEGAKLRIPNGSALTIQNSYLFACGNAMWNGIELEKGGTLTTQSTTSTTGRPIIADAVVAINGPTTSGSIGMLNLNNTNFYRNWVSVNIPGIAGYTNYTGTIRGCNFTYNSNAPLDNYLLGAAYAGKHPAVGIFANYITGAQWNIGGGTGNNNVFERLNNGIYAFRSNVRVIDHNVFNLIHNYDAVNVSSGSAVYAAAVVQLTPPLYGTNLRVVTNSIGGAAAFTSCQTAVSINNASAVIQDNYMLNDSIGIYATNGGWWSWDFNHNTITNTFAGITFNNANSLMVRTMRAYDNTITVNEPAYRPVPATSYPSPYGIGHLEANASSVACSDGSRNCRVLMEQNNIYHGRYGIYVNNAYGTRITNNNITQNNLLSYTGVKAGIYVSGSFDPLITINDLTGNGTAYDEAPTTTTNRRSGVLINNTGSAELCNNEFYNLGYAMQFQANCENTELKNNTINGGAKYGLVLKKVGAEGVISTQGTTSLSHGNQFNGTYYNTGSFQTYTFNSNGQNSTFRINNSSSNAAQPWPNGADVLLYEIPKGNSNSASTWQCSTGPGIYKGLVITPGNAYSKQIAEGRGDELVDEGLEQSGSWMLEKSLFAQFKQNPALKNSKALYADFYNSKEQTSIGSISDYDDALLLLNDTTLVTDSISLEAQIESTIAINNQLQATEPFELNRKWVNNIYLNTLAKGITTFTATEKQEIYALANQCPYEAGDAVYIARTLYNVIDHTAYFNDEDVCLAAVARKKEQAKKLPKDFSVSVYPNPASRIVDIVVSGTQQDMLLTVYNTLGQVVGSAHVNGYVELDVSDFENGVYQLVFTNLAGQQYSTRLVVAK